MHTAPSTGVVTRSQANRLHATQGTSPDLGNEDGVMPKEQSPRKPTTRRYSPAEKAAAVRVVRTLRAELGTEHGTVQRVARQLEYGFESVRSWVRQADIDDGYVPGVSTAESARVKDLEQHRAKPTLVGGSDDEAAGTDWCRQERRP